MSKMEIITITVQSLNPFFDEPSGDDCINALENIARPLVRSIIRQDALETVSDEVRLSILFNNGQNSRPINLTLAFILAYIDEDSDIKLYRLEFPHLSRAMHKTVIKHLKFHSLWALYTETLECVPIPATTSDQLDPMLQSVVKRYEEQMSLFRDSN